MVTAAKFDLLDFSDMQKTMLVFVFASTEPDGHQRLLHMEKEGNKRGKCFDNSKP